MSDNTDEESGLWASIHASLGGIHDTLKSMHKHQTTWLQRANDEARDYTLRGNGIMPASGTESLSFPLSALQGNSPQPGRVWVLRRVVIGPPLATTASQTATSVLLFQSPSDPLNTTVPTTAELIDSFGTTNPIIHWYGGRQVVIRSSDALWVVITGGEASNQWVANAQIEDYADGGYRSEVNL